MAKKAVKIGNRYKNLIVYSEDQLVADLKLIYNIEPSQIKDWDSFVSDAFRELGEQFVSMVIGDPVVHKRYLAVLDHVLTDLLKMNDIKVSKEC